MVKNLSGKRTKSTVKGNHQTRLSGLDRWSKRNLQKNGGWGAHIRKHRQRGLSAGGQKKVRFLCVLWFKGGARDGREKNQHEESPNIHPYSGKISLQNRLGEKVQHTKKKGSTATQLKIHHKKPKFQNYSYWAQKNWFRKTKFRAG